MKYQYTIAFIIIILLVLAGCQKELPTKTPTHNPSNAKSETKDIDLNAPDEYSSNTNILPSEKSDISTVSQYKISEEILNIGDNSLYYPKMENATNHDIVNTFNEEIIKILDFFSDLSHTYERINLNYNISQNNENIISIDFSGEYSNWSTKSNWYYYSVTMDLITGKILQLDDFYYTDIDFFTLCFEEKYLINDVNIHLLQEENTLKYSIELYAKNSTVRDGSFSYWLAPSYLYIRACAITYPDQYWTFAIPYDTIQTKENNESVFWG